MALFKKSKLDEVEAANAPDPLRRTIMIVDDEEANLTVMAAIVRPYYRLILAHDGQEALEMIEAMDDPSSLACIISDQRMPRLTGVELFQHAHQLLPRTIRIIVTGFIDLDAIVDSINKAEIYKFIIKPFDTNDFVITIKRAIETFNMRQQLHAYHIDLEEKVQLRTKQLADKHLELEKAYRALEEVSLTDPLTNLRNRRFLLQQLDADIALSLRCYDETVKNGIDELALDADLIFFMIDLDHFKAVNDEFGHAAGDMVLVQVRERLQEISRESDFLVRWGGEEFLVVARQTNRAEAQGMAERIRNIICSREFELADGVRLKRTCSIGFSCFPFLPAHPRLLSWMQVVELADQGLYMAKRGGRNRWYGLCGPNSHEFVPGEAYFHRLVQDIRHAESIGELRIEGSAG